MNYDFFLTQERSKKAKTDSMIYKHTAYLLKQNKEISMNDKTQY